MSSHRVLYDAYRAAFLMTDPGDAGTITVDRYSAVVPLVTGGSGETRTLAQPTKAGLICTVELDTDGGGDAVLTVTGGYNADAATSITLGDAGDFVTFVSIKVGASYYWRVVAHEGTNVAGEDFTVDQLTATTGTVTTLGSTTATLSKLLGAVTTVNAAGSVAANAGVLTTNMINIVGAADNTTAVILPVAVAGQVVIVKSTVASKTLPVFPQVNSYINGTVNNACTLDSVAAGASAIFVASDSTHWYTISGDLA